MSDPNVHVDTHPTGQPNRTAVNPENPIFGRPADPVPEVSIEQAAVVQSAKHPRETVTSPLINEEVVSPPAPNADDWTRTAGEGLTADTADAETGAEYRHGSGEGSSKITPVEVVALPTQDQADAIVAKAEAEEIQRKQEAVVEERMKNKDKFKIGDKVRFTPESGNDMTLVYTIDSGQFDDGPQAWWFWHLVEFPGSLFVGDSLQLADPAAA